MLSRFADGFQVATEVFARLPRTLELIAAAALISIAVGVPLGVLAALKRGGWVDRLTMAIAGLSLSVPVFVAVTSTVTSWPGAR